MPTKTITRVIKVKKPSELLSQVLQIRVTQKEWKLVHKLARENDVTYSSYLRKILLKRLK